MIWDLEGKTALVTGAGSGIGKEVALGLASQGVAVAVADLDMPKARATSAQIEARGGRALAIETDVSDPAQVDTAVATTQSKFGPSDYLVNIAGFNHWAAVQDISDADWARMINVHLSGTFYCCRAVLAEMIARRFGRIVNMSSLHALRGQALGSHYSAAKGGIIGFTKALAREVASKGILVNAVAPGPIDTPLWRGSLHGEELEAQIARRVEVIALGRLGEAREVADVILFLLSPASSYITGQVITIDGGELMA
jgi:NAD(P)-dependent dehydrogenase (short-subunit alcohol dehydrogenase family)